jgi:hypothetical protein
MTETTSSSGFREVRGVFTRLDAMQDAVGRLSVSGFDRADLTLPTRRSRPLGGTRVTAGVFHVESLAERARAKPRVPPGNQRVDIEHRQAQRIS